MTLQISFQNCMTSLQVLKQVYLKINELDTDIKVDPSCPYIDQKKESVWGGIMAIQDDIFGVLSDIKSEPPKHIHIDFKNINDFRENNPEDFVKFIDLFDWLKEDLKQSSDIDFSYNIIK